MSLTDGIEEQLTPETVRQIHEAEEAVAKWVDLITRFMTATDVREVWRYARELETAWPVARRARVTIAHLWPAIIRAQMLAPPRPVVLPDGSVVLVKGGAAREVDPRWKCEGCSKTFVGQLARSDAAGDPALPEVLVHFCELCEKRERGVR